MPTRRSSLCGSWGRSKGKTPAPGARQIRRIRRPYSAGRGGKTMSNTVLVVDDEPNIVELARLYLRNEGFDVEVAENGREALEKACSLNPKLVLLDIMMPEMG